jgi:hypothetical protein
LWWWILLVSNHNIIVTIAIVRLCPLVPTNFFQPFQGCIRQDQIKRKVLHVDILIYIWAQFEHSLSTMASIFAVSMMLVTLAQASPNYNAFQAALQNMSKFTIATSGWISMWSMCCIIVALACL